MSKPSSTSPTDVDFSVIRTSIDMGHSVLDQILNGIHYGSDEVRALLREECDFIMECKVCRNLFRSFPNFVAHKRVYCMEACEDRMPEDIINLRRPETETVVLLPESPDGNKDGKKGKEKSKGESLVDKVVNKTYQSNSVEYELYTKAAEKIVHSKAGKTTTTMKLTPIPSSTKAMTAEYSNSDTHIEYDGTSTENKEDSPNPTTSKKKKTLSEVCASLLGKQSDNSMVTNVVRTSSSKKSSQPDRNRKSTPKKMVGNGSENESNKGSSGSKQTDMEVDDAVTEWSGTSKQSSKVKDKSPTSKSSPERMETSPSEKDAEAYWMQMCDFKKLKCTACKTVFSTVHSLKHHCKTIHSEGKFYSKCPICHKEFCYFASVARHLRNVHMKSEQQIQEYKKKMNARSKFVEVISPESMNKLHSGSAGKTDNKSSHTHGWKKCDKCQKLFSKAKSYKRHILGKCSPKAQTDKSAPNSENLDNGVLEKRSRRNKKEPEYVYEEKTLNKTSRLYQTLASPTGGKPPTIVYVYPKSPIQDASLSRQKSKEADVSDEKPRKRTSMEVGEKKKLLRNNVNREKDTVTNEDKETKENKKVEETNRDEKKLTDSVDTGHKTINENDESIVLGNDDVVDFQNDQTEAIDSADSITCDPIHVKHKVETRSVSSEHLGNKNETIDIKNRSPSKLKASPKKIDDPKKKVELNKLKHRLMSEAFGECTKTQDIETYIQTGLKNRREMTDQQQDLELENTVGQDKEKTPLKTNEGRYSSALRSSISSVGADSPLPKSDPTSPTSVSSMDGYSHKFKMTVQEMAELVETATLTKFAKERKKRAHDILNKKNSKDMLGSNLATTMKRTIRGNSILPRKTYSTRFKSGTVTKGKINVNSGQGMQLKKTTQERHDQVLNLQSVQQLKPKQEEKNEKIPVKTKVNQKEALQENIDKPSKNDKESVTHQTEKKEKISNDLEGDGGNSQRKKLSRELKLLENTPGFNKESYYDFRTNAESHKQSNRETTHEQSETSSSQLTDEEFKSALNKFKEKILASCQSLDKSNSQASRVIPDTVCIDQSTVKGTKQGEGKVRLSRSDLHKSKNTHENYLKPTDKGRQTSRSRSPSSVSDLSMSDKDSVTGTRSLRKGTEMDSLSSSRDTSIERKGSGVSKKLSRELKLLENSTGFNEKGYYHSPAESKDKNDNQQAGDMKHKSVTSQYTKQNDIRDIAATRNERTSGSLTVVKQHDQKKNIATKDVEKKEVFKSIVEIQSDESNRITNSPDLSDRVRQHDSPKKSKSGKQSHVGKNIRNNPDAPEHNKPDAGAEVTDGKSLGIIDQGETNSDEAKGNVTSNELKDDSADATAAHRTRLSTGSIFFDSELLKTSPSKLDPVETRASAYSNKQALDRIRKRLSLTPRKKMLFQAEKIVRQRNKSGPERFSLETGVKKCERCGKKFWKIKTFRLHVRRGKCGNGGEQTVLSEEARRKRTLSRSPRHVDNMKASEGDERGDNLSKRPRLAIEDVSGHKVELGKSKGSEKVEFPMVVMKNIDEVIKNKIKEKEEQDKKRKDMAENTLEIETLQRNTPRPHTLSNDKTNANETSKAVSLTEVAGPSQSFAEDSDAESDFSGFSEKDLEEQDIETTYTEETEGGSLHPNTMMLNERANTRRMIRNNKSSVGTGIVKREGLRGKKVNPWTKKRSSSTPFWSYVCDSKRPRKMLCQVTKNVDKMVDSQRLVCKYCDSKHTSVSNLRQHAIRHLGWKRYKCKLCTFTGYNRSEVTLHFTRKHSMITRMGIDSEDYVTDLKTEANKRRASRRCNTLRERRAQGISSKSSSDIYAKPRPNVSITKTKAGRNIKSDTSDAGSSIKGQNTNNNLSAKNAESPNILLKARQRLSNVLKP